MITDDEQDDHEGQHHGVAFVERVFLNAVIQQNQGDDKPQVK